jgi:hypothetical protein
MKRAFIIAASENYLPGLKALLNSIDVHQPDADVILLSFRLPPDFLIQFNYEESGDCIHRVICSESDDQVHGTAIERFKVAAEVAKDYDSICLMDADMFLLEDCSTFFDVAAAGFIVTGSNGMIVNFNRDYQDRYGVDLGSDDYVYTKVHTSVPIFINQDNIDWFAALYNSRRVDHWDDFLYLNLIGAKMGKDKKMICLPPYQFTGIHHFQMKPETRLVEKGGKILSATEEQAYMVHGKWWDEAWLQDLMPTMERYLNDEQRGDKCRQKVIDSIQLIKDRFNHYLNLR